VSNAIKNTDRELWRKIDGDYYSPSIHVTAGDDIGINVGGTVFVMPVEKWHGLRAIIKELGQYACDMPGGPDKTAFETLVNQVAAEASGGE